MFLDEDNSMTQIQRTFSGNRCSDHLTVLNAFHKWSSSCHRDINTTNYCNNKMLSQTSLKITKNVTVLFYFIRMILIIKYQW